MLYVNNIDAIGTTSPNIRHVVDMKLVGILTAQK